MHKNSERQKKTTYAENSLLVGEGQPHIDHGLIEAQARE